MKPKIQSIDKSQKLKHFQSNKARKRQKRKT